MFNGALRPVHPKSKGQKGELSATSNMSGLIGKGSQPSHWGSGDGAMKATLFIM